MRLGEYGASNDSPDSWSNQADSAGPSDRKTFVKSPTRVRFIEPPKMKRRRWS